MKLPNKLNLPNEVALKVNEILDYLAEKFPDETWICEHCQEKIPVGTTHDCGSSKTITLPKPEWWDWNFTDGDKKGYLEALEAASKASGITFLLED